MARKPSTPFTPSPPNTSHNTTTQRSQYATYYRRILEAGKALGLELNFHGDEINPMQAGELGGELNALSISHLERVLFCLLALFFVS